MWATVPLARMSTSSRRRAASPATTSRYGASWLARYQSKAASASGPDRLSAGFATASAAFGAWASDCTSWAVSARSYSRKSWTPTCRSFCPWCRWPTFTGTGTRMVAVSRSSATSSGCDSPFT